MAALGPIPDPARRRDAEHLAAGLPPLLVAAERVASTVVQGVHGRRRVGSGETFWQFRRYQAGDEAQAIDWRRSARSDRLYIREHEWEAAQSVWLWCDRSASMRYASTAALPQKLERAQLLLLALAILLVRGGEHVGLFGFDRLATGGRGSIDRLEAALAAAAPGESLPPVGRLSRFSHLVMFGDFLSPLSNVDTVLRGYAAQGVSGHLVQILDPAEEDLPFHGRTEFEGLENEAPYLAGRVESLRPAYQRRIAARREALQDMARRVGWTATFYRTDGPAQTALLSIYSGLGLAGG